MLYCWRYDMYAVNSHKISAWFCWPYPSSCPLLSYKTCCIVHTASHLHNLPFSPVPSYCTTHFCLLSYKFQLDHHFLILNLHSCCLIPHSIMFNIQSLIIPWNIITYIYIHQYPLSINKTSEITVHPHQSHVNPHVWWLNLYFRRWNPMIFSYEAAMFGRWNPRLRRLSPSWA